jgi:hypothetical protein
MGVQRHRRRVNVCASTTRWTVSFESAMSIQSRHVHHRHTLWVLADETSRLMRRFHNDVARYGCETCECVQVGVINKCLDVNASTPEPVYGNA